MLLGEVGMTMADFLNANWPYFAAGITATVGAVGYAGRVIWSFIAAELGKLRERQEKKAGKEYELLDTLTVHLPQQTETLRAMKETLTDSRLRDSDFIKQVRELKEGAGEMTYAFEATAAPDARKEVERFAKRAREKMGIVGLPPTGATQ